MGADVVSDLGRRLKRSDGAEGVGLALPLLVGVLNGALAAWVAWSAVGGVWRSLATVLSFVSLCAVTVFLVSTRGLPSEVLGTGFVLTGGLLVARPFVALLLTLPRTTGGGLDVGLFVGATVRTVWSNLAVLVVGGAVVLFGGWLTRQGKLQAVQRTRTRLADTGMTEWEWDWLGTDD